jgi:hypothetical protein
MFQDYLIVERNSIELHHICVDGVKNAVKNPDIKTLLIDTTWEGHSSKVEDKFRSVLPGEIDAALPDALKKHGETNIDELSKKVTEGFESINASLLVFKRVRMPFELSYPPYKSNRMLQIRR